MNLAAIEAHGAAREWAVALDEVLAAWRRTRCPAYGDLVEALSAKTSAPPIPRRTGPGAFHAAWLERAANATESDLVPLLESFGTELSTTRARPGWDTTAAARRVRAALARENAVLGDLDGGPFMALSARVEALAALGPDPRIARTMLAFVRNLPVSTQGAISVATYGPVLDLIAEMRDVRTIPALERCLAEPPAKSAELRAFLERELARALTLLRGVAVETPPDARTAAALAQRLGYRGEAPANAERSSPDVAELFELVVRDLEDDGPRAVLADRWLEVGDPRGELVTLQLRGAATPEDLEKLRALVWYDRDWLGELALVTRSRVYVRGFLDAFELPPEAAATPERWDAATSNPNLGTVRTLRCGAGSERHYRAFLFSPAMRNLEDAEIPSLRLLRDVLDAPQLGKVRRLLIGVPASVSEEALRSGVAAAAARPEIERVTVRSMSTTLLLPMATERTAVTVMTGSATVTARRTPEGLLVSGDDAEKVVRYLRRSRRGEPVRVES